MTTTRLTFKSNLAQISVPATSANLGPGFDCFGLALEMRDFGVLNIWGRSLAELRCVL